MEDEVMDSHDREEFFPIKPRGVRYRCPFCDTGEMKFDADYDIQAHRDNSGKTSRLFHGHRCTDCEKTLLLPKVYPYIDWKPEEGENID